MQLRTARLVLRPFEADDLAAFEAFARDAAYRRFLGTDHPEPARFVENNLGVDGAWVIELDGRVVGSVFVGDEVACLLDPAVHGMGIASEVGPVVIADAFERRGFTEILGRADPSNTASLQAMARLGLRPGDDGTFRLRRADWEAARDAPSP